MRKQVKALLVGALSLSAAVAAPGAFGAEGCPNEQLRIENNSTALPECRAYELVSPDSNHASLGSSPSGHAAADGGVMAYQLIDAPDHANSANIFNIVRATRDPAIGWSGASLAAVISEPPTVFQALTTTALASDLESTVELSDQSLSGGPVPGGLNVFVRRSGGPYRLATTAGSPLIGGLDSYFNPAFVWGTPDFSHIYFLPKVPQLPEDPLALDNTYSWSEADGLHLIGILPNETPAPDGATLATGMLQPGSSDGRYAVFQAEGKLYLRIDDSQTVEVAASQRTVADPNPPATPVQAGITADGSKILFTSASELTNDANTGQSGGVAADAGRDLYSYDTATAELTDLTPDANPADLATGANVQAVAGATTDASYVYFTAKGVLAPGATAGHTSLYVSHEGHIAFVAEAGGMVSDPNASTPGQVYFYVTPDGRHVAFLSTDPLTAYNNNDPVTATPHAEVFTYEFNSGLACASCRPDGSRPTADSALPSYHGLPPNRSIRVMSDDGSRVFFLSSDAVLPQASSGHQQVFEYSHGSVSPISNLAGTSDASFLDASATGNDVFIATYDALVPNANSGDAQVFDARVNGGFPVAVAQRCSGAACEPSATPPPRLASAALVSFNGDATAAAAAGKSPGSPEVSFSKVRTIRGTAGSLSASVPGKGRLTVSGLGLQTERSSPTKAETVVIKLQLTRSAARALKKKRSFKTRVKVSFLDGAGHTSTATLSFTFKLGSTRKGR